MTFSDHLYLLRDLLAQLGVEVRLHEHELEVCGRCDYQQRIIYINEPTSKLALMALAHEGGHWWSYLLWHDLDFVRHEREQLAFLLGWWLLVAVGVVGDGRQQVRVSDWYADHFDLFNRELGVVMLPYDGFRDFVVLCKATSQGTQSDTGWF